MSRYEQITGILKDIVIPVILGICSIAVAVAANDIAKSSNETARLQALIAKNAEAPTIELYHTLGDIQHEASISISILDGKYSNFAYDTVSFLSFAFLHHDENDYWAALDSVDIPIQYYAAGRGQQAMYGKIWELNSDMAAEVELLCNGCKEYYREKNHIEPGEPIEPRFRVSIITCLKCTYLNLLEEEESVYYMIGPTGLVSQINQEQGLAWFQKYEDMHEDSFFLFTYQIEENDVDGVFQLIDQIGKNGKQYLGTDDLDE